MKRRRRRLVVASEDAFDHVDQSRLGWRRREIADGGDGGTATFQGQVSHSTLGVAPHHEF